MTHHIGKFLCLLAITVASCTIIFAEDAMFEDGQVLIQLSDKVLPLTIDTVGGKLTTGIGWLDSISWNHNLQQIEKLIPDPDFPKAHKLHLMVFPEDSSSEGLLDLFLGKPELEYATLNYVPTFFDPNDAQYNAQWYVPQVGVPDVWDNGQGVIGSNTVLIAVLDVGVDVLHQDFGVLGSARIFTNPAEEPLDFTNYTQGGQLGGGDGDDNDNNGVIDDYCGAQFRIGETNNAYPCCIDINDPNPHGTWVSGIIAGQTNNSFGIAGLAGGWGPIETPGVKILPTRISHLFSILDALIYSKQIAEANNMKLIVNMSFGFTNVLVPDLEQAINDLYNQTDVEVLMVAGVGNVNYDWSIGVFPADYSEVIGVGALDQDNQKARFSNYGDSVDVAAPGVSITSLGLNNGILTSSGTSASAPIVSGVAALLWSSPEFESLDRHALKARLLGTSVRIEHDEPYFVDDLGSGLINATAAFMSDVQPALRLFDRVILAGGNDIIDPGESVSLEVWLRNYWEPANTIIGELSSNDPDITVINSLSTMGTLQTDAFGAFQSSFTFTVSPTATSGYKFLDIELEANGGLYQESISIPVLIAPQRFDPIVVEDVTGAITGFVIEDTDIDGWKELIFGTGLSTGNSGRIYKVEANGFTSFADTDEFWTLKGKPAVANFDSDPELEIVTISNHSSINQTRLLIWNHVLGVEYGPVLVANRLTVTDPLVEDLNGDGQMDILVCTDNAGQHSEVVAYTILNFQLVELWRYTAPEMSTFRVLNDIACGDIDGDFRQEVIMIGKGSFGLFPSATFLHFLNGEDGTIAREPYSLGQNVNPTGAVQLADIHGADGLLDVVCGVTSNIVDPVSINRSVYVFDFAQSSLCGPVNAEGTTDPNDLAERIVFDPSLTNLPEALAPYRMQDDAYSFANPSPTIGENCVTASELDIPTTMHCVAGNIDGDNRPEVVGCGTLWFSEDQQSIVSAFDQSGLALDIWSFQAFDHNPLWTSPAINDWDGDGLTDVTFLLTDDTDQEVRIYNPQSTVPYDRSTQEWPELHHDARNTNRYHQPIAGIMEPGEFTLSGRVKLVSDLIVSEGTTLTILPGTIIEANDGVGIVVDGILNIEGTANDSVKFRSISGGIQWEGIHVYSGEFHAVFCMIENAHLPIFIEIPVANVTISDCEIVGGENGLRFWGGTGVSYDIDRVTVRDIPNLAHHVGVYFLNAVVFCDDLVIENSGYRTAYIVNHTGKFTNCSFSGSTANYGMAFSGATCAPVLRCCEIDHIAPQNFPASPVWCLSSAAPVFGEVSGVTPTTNNQIVDNSGTLVLFSGSAGRPKLGGQRKNILIQENLAQGGKLMTWTSPGGFAYDARSNYWGGTPLIGQFDPANPTYWAFNGYLTQNPGLCPGAGPLDDISVLDSALYLESQGLWNEAQDAYLQNAANDTLGFNDRYSSLSRAIAIDRIVESIDTTAVAVLSASIGSIAVDENQDHALRALELTHMTDDGLFESALSGFESLLNEGLGPEDSILTLIDILHVQLLSGSDSVSVLTSNGVGKERRLFVSSKAEAARSVSDLLEEIIELNRETDRKTGIPDDYALYQNYPNPFNPSTDIRFDLPEAIRVELKIFNILGQEVVTLVDDVRNAGAFRILWDGKNAGGLSVASGVYVYQLKTGNFQDAKKMVLIR